MGNQAGYVVRETVLTNAGHIRITVVDLHGRIAHLTVRADHYPTADVHTLIVDRLAQLGEPKRPPT
jgi:hypothetical protein